MTDAELFPNPSNPSNVPNVCPFWSQRVESTDCLHPHVCPHCQLAIKCSTKSLRSGRWAINHRNLKPSYLPGENKRLWILLPAKFLSPLLFHRRKLFTCYLQTVLIKKGPLFCLMWKFPQSGPIVQIFGCFLFSMLVWFLASQWRQQWSIRRGWLAISRSISEAFFPLKFVTWEACLIGKQNGVFELVYLFKNFSFARLLN